MDDDIRIILRRARLQQKLSQRDLAEKVDLHKQQVANYEGFRNWPPVASFWPICEALGLDPQELAKPFILQKYEWFINQ